MNEEKTRQLGMNVGKANAILRKRILFSLVKKCGLDTCFRCKKALDSVEDFTIDHKDSWLHSADPVKNFFDLDNIAFSHASCNYAARNRCSKARNKSGLKGVRFFSDRRRKKPWKAEISINGKNKVIGFFLSAEEAAEAYKNEALKACSSGVERFPDTEEVAGAKPASPTRLDGHVAQ